MTDNDFLASMRIERAEFEPDYAENLVALAKIPGDWPMMTFDYQCQKCGHVGKFSVHVPLLPPRGGYVLDQIEAHRCDKCGSAKTLPPARTTGKECR